MLEDLKLQPFMKSIRTMHSYDTTITGGAKPNTQVLPLETVRPVPT